MVRHRITKLLIGLALCILPVKALEVRLAWETNAEPDVVGYRVYWGSASRAYSDWIDVGKLTKLTLTNLPNHRLFFAVTAWNGAGLESDYSNEVWVGGPVPGLPGPHRGGMVTAM